MQPEVKTDRVLIDLEVTVGAETFSGTWAIDAAKWRSMDREDRRRYVERAMENEMKGFVRKSWRKRNVRSTWGEK